jgi:hypothetical protein
MRVDNERTLPPSGLSLLSYGIGWTGTDQQDATVYVDSVVVDTGPVPCQ